MSNIADAYWANTIEFVALNLLCGRRGCNPKRQADEEAMLTIGGLWTLRRRLAPGNVVSDTLARGKRPPLLIYGETYSQARYRQEERLEAEVDVMYSVENDTCRSHHKRRSVR